MVEVVGLLALIVLTLFLLAAGKWLLAAITILCGDKDGLKDFGNLCEKEPDLNGFYRDFDTWQDREWYRKGK